MNMPEDWIRSDNQKGNNMTTEQLKLTPIDQIEDMADGVPVLAVEGEVKFAMDLTRSKPDAPHPWTKQFFVLSSGTAEIACSMWDAEGSEMKKGEKVHIENTQDGRGNWSGMKKSSYQKNGERKHTLEIRANQVKIISNNATKYGSSNVPVEEQTTMPPARYPDWPESEKPKAMVGEHYPVKSTLDERQRAIIRQHSQSMALEVLKLKVELKELTVEDLTPSKLKTLADYFDNDVLGATQ